MTNMNSGRGVLTRAACLWAALAMSVAAGGAAAQTATPYAGQQDRAIASLSQADIDALLAGQGWGLAKPAELNGYPGPAHVLELADELGLSADQRRQIEAVFAEMQAEARRLGAEYVSTEEHLSMMFRMGHASSGSVRTLLDKSAQTLAALRHVHLDAHVQVTPLLSDAQKATYSELRGYGSGLAGGHDAHAGHGSH